MSNCSFMHESRKCSLLIFGLFFTMYHVLRLFKMSDHVSIVLCAFYSVKVSVNLQVAQVFSIPNNTDL